MGSWGAGILEDDESLDRVGEYTALREDGRTPAEAAAGVLAARTGALRDIAALALAEHQMACRPAELTGAVRFLALAAIDRSHPLVTRRGTGLRPDGERRRAEVLRDLARRLHAAATID